MSYRLVAARAGARVLRSPGWLRTVRASPTVAGLRTDRARTVLEVAAVLALTARADSTAAPTWPVLIEASGYSRATVARVLAWLHTHKLLVTLENGSTEQFRPQPRPRRDRPAPVPVEGNRAAVYLLTEPLPDSVPEGVQQTGDVEQARQSYQDQGGHYRPTATSDQESAQVNIPRATVHRLETPPHLSRRESVKNNPTGACAREMADAEGSWWFESNPRRTAKTWCAAGKDAQKRAGAPEDGLTRGQRRAALLAVAEQLRARSLDLRALSVAAVASVIRVFVADGWGVEDLVWAIDHTPDGKARTYTAGLPTSSPARSTASVATAGSSVVDVEQVLEVAAERRRRGVVPDGGARAARAVAYPAAWLRWRLGPWVGLGGPVAASRTAAEQRSAAAASAARARRAAHAAAAAAAVPLPLVMAEARAALRARRTW